MRPMIAAVLLLSAAGSAADGPPPADPVEQACVAVQQRVAQHALRLAEDELYAHLCTLRGAAPDKFAEAMARFDVEKRVGPNETLRQVSVADLLHSGHADVAARTSGKWVWAFVPKDQAANFPLVKKERLGSNPVSRIASSHSMHGHFEATGEALVRITKRAGPSTSDADKALLVPAGWFPARVHKLMQDASQDADYYDWSTPPAHAQAACNEEGDARTQVCPEAEGADCAKKRTFAWVRKHTTAAIAACGNGSAAEAAVSAYWLGYALHAVEDLAPHRGRTNCEHAYNAYDRHGGGNPDDADANYQLAVDLASRFLSKAVTVLPPSCLAGFKAMSAAAGGDSDVPYQSREWKKSVLNEGWGTAWGAGLLKYRFGLSDRYAAIAATEHPVRWFGEEPTEAAGTGLTRCSGASDCEAVWQQLQTAVFAPAP